MKNNKVLHKKGIYEKYIKRILDFTISLIALIGLSPILLIIAILVKSTSKGNIFFLQRRLGKDGKEFNIIKFRTMIPNAEKIGDGLRVNSESDSRITKIGKILRKTSLDELPQIINVLIGEMSLIGPRPPVIYYPHRYEDYSEEQKQRFTVRPGITGLAQVRVRNSATWDERIEIDIEYIKNISFILDIKILFSTVKQVVNTKNIYADKDKNKVKNIDKAEERVQRV